MIQIYCREVREDEIGQFRPFLRPKVDGTAKRKKIPESAVYETHNGHSNHVGDQKDNYVYWDKDFNQVMAVRVNKYTTWGCLAEVPKGVATQHKNQLKRWLEEFPEKFETMQDAKDWVEKFRKDIPEDICPKFDMENPTHADIIECEVICKNKWECHTYRHVCGDRPEKEHFDEMIEKPIEAMKSAIKDLEELNRKVQSGEFSPAYGRKQRLATLKHMETTWSY